MANNLSPENVRVGQIYAGATPGRDRKVIGFDYEHRRVKYVLRGKYGAFNGNPKGADVEQFIRTAGNAMKA